MIRALSSTLTLSAGFAALIGACVAISPASAQQGAQPGAKPIEKIGDWSLYSVGTGKAKICYAVTSPKERKPDLRRDPAYFFITNRPGENVKNEITIVLGFDAKADSKPKAEIGNATFDMGAKGPQVWVDNAAKEPAFVAALRKGKSLVVKTTSQRGNVTTDTYALAGVDKAIDRIAKECP
jgi:invasion protein IalB